MSVPTDTPSTDGAPDLEEVIARELRAIGVAHDLSVRDAAGIVSKLAAAGWRVVPEDRPAPCRFCDGSGVVEENHGQGLFEALGCPDCQATGFAAGVPALDDDTRREVEALIEQHQWAIDREHPCSGACLGCGAGVDESCDPDCGCDEGEMSCDTAQVLEPLGPLIRFVAAYLGGTDGR